MTYFIDSGVWIAGYNKKDLHHEAGKKILTALANNQLGIAIISDQIFNEVVTFLRKKFGFDASNRAAEGMINSPHVATRMIDENTFNATYHIFQLYERLSFTDASTVVIMKNEGIRFLFSFDSDFDGIKDVVRLADLPE
ncbi:MAG TPA: PIN domain-containing protein [Candidatus Lokiarchaeia archaeon]|nr:PIN domain-containing protein [Candidatus Lokiarchaeia archaeon]